MAFSHVRMTKVLTPQFYWNKTSVMTAINNASFCLLNIFLFFEYPLVKIHTLGLKYRYGKA